MKKYFFFWVIMFVAGSLFAQGKRESIFDKISYVDTVLYKEIPHVFRWCDRLKLKNQKINVGDCSLYVEEQGKGTPIVLINGGPGGTHHDFHPWFSEAAKFARVIYYDQRGCGLSDFYPGKEGYSVDQAVNDLDAIRKALKIKKWVLLGYSYGGFLAQYYTTKFPGSTAGLILLGASPNIEIKDDESREDLFISKEESARMEKIRAELNALFKQGLIDRKKYTQLSIYNNVINGDWKRQNFYKPSRERAAQTALYEWVNDNNFNQILNNSAGKEDLAGAFNMCPIPTLILEGRWDLTWSENKKEALKNNHPGSRMIIFENAAHGIFDEDPVKFFGALKEFVSDLKPVNAGKILEYSAYLKKRDEKLASDPKSIIRILNWGLASSKVLTQKYSREWLGTIKEPTEYLRIGFAHYDMNNYKEALYVFEQMEKIFTASKDTRALALIWQAHMLDLVGNRNEAVSIYKLVGDMNLENTMQHGQYGLKYKISPYAKERMNTPFVRKENSGTD